MKEGDQAKNGLESKGVNTKLCLNNGMQNDSLASDDVPKKQGLDSLSMPNLSVSNLVPKSQSHKGPWA